MLDEVSALEELERRRMYGKTPARQPQHCEHECMCSLYGVECWYGREPCDMKGVLIKPCIHDTRKATHTSPPAPVSGLDKWTYEEVMQEISDAFDRGVLVGEEVEAKAAREQVAKELDTALNMAGEDKDYQLYNMKEVLRSLRQHSERGGE